MKVLVRLYAVLPVVRQESRRAAVAPHGSGCARNEARLPEFAKEPVQGRRLVVQNRCAVAAAVCARWAVSAQASAEPLRRCVRSADYTARRMRKSSASASTSAPAASSAVRETREGCGGASPARFPESTACPVAGDAGGEAGLRFTSGASPGSDTSDTPAVPTGRSPADAGPAAAAAPAGPRARARSSFCSRSLSDRTASRTRFFAASAASCGCAAATAVVLARPRTACPRWCLAAQADAPTATAKRRMHEALWHRLPTSARAARRMPSGAQLSADPLIGSIWALTLDQSIRSARRTSCSGTPHGSRSMTSRSPACDVVTSSTSVAPAATRRSRSAAGSSE